MVSFSWFCIHVFITQLIPWYSFSDSLRISLSGDDWIITDNKSFFARGQIPGTIHTLLFAANKIPEPYFDDNDVKLRSLVYSSWIFQKQFTLTSDFHLFTKWTLNMDQIDTVATITLNGCVIGQTSSMFIPYVFDIAKSCLNINNELSIVFQSPILYAMNQAKLYNETLLPICPSDIQHGECYIQFIRKEICSFSWDWGPAFAPIGIPKDLYLVGSKTTDVVIQIESINVASYHIDIHQWQIDILLTTTSPTVLTELDFILENTSYIYHERNSTLYDTISISLYISDHLIELWWPNGYGQPILYKLSVYNRGQFIGSRKIGFRTVQLIEHDYGPTINGTSFYFLINYYPIFIKGSNWIPPDAFQERVSNDQLERLLRSAQVANMNMLRISGVGIYERDAFYDMADRFGIMLWHDFMFGNALYPVDEVFLTNVKNEIKFQVKRLQSHPSIVLWAANNENEVAIAENWYDIPEERMDKVKDEYRKLNIDVIIKAVKEVDQGNNRPLIVSSPTNGVGSVRENYIANDPNSPLYGDMHFYGFHNDTWDTRTYPIPRFLTETGIQSLPSFETWLEVTNDQSDLRFNSDLVQHREHSNGQMNSIMIHIEKNLPLPNTNDSLKIFQHLIYLSQVNQAMTLKSISDFCRLHSSMNMLDRKSSFGNTMGMLYWQINDIWQGVTWSTIEFNLRWKLSHYYVKTMFAPIYPILFLNPYLADRTDLHAQISIDVINERLNIEGGRLVCSIYTLDTFAIQLSFTFDVVFDSSMVQHIIDLPYASTMQQTNCSINNNHCIVHCSFDYHHQTITQTLFLKRPKEYYLYQPYLQIQAIERVASTTLRLIVTSSRPALFVWLESTRTISGYFSQNGFHMFSSTIVIDFHSWTTLENVDLNQLNFRVNSLFDVTQT